MKNIFLNNKLEKWISKNISDLGEIINITKFEVGQSNPTYKIEFNKKNIVLRSQPKGTLLRGAHRIDREYKVMSALYNTKIPVPKMLCYCNEKKIIGTEFYLMDYIEGIQETNPILPKFGIINKKKIYKNKLDILINLSKLNLKKIEMENFSKSYNYIEKQIKLWIDQYRASETKKIKSMEFLIDKLIIHIPKIFEKLPNVLIHGDFRLDNMILEKRKKNEVLGLLDWELSTLAPPFIDLSYWSLMLRFKKEWAINGLGFDETRENIKGIPSEKEIFDTYSNALSYDISKYWDYLLAFNSFRFAGILQGITKRVLIGNNAGQNAKKIGKQAEPVAKMGEIFLKKYI